MSLKFLFVDVNDTGSPWLGPCLLIPLALLLPLLVRRSPPWWLVVIGAVTHQRQLRAGMVAAATVPE